MNAPHTAATYRQATVVWNCVSVALIAGLVAAIVIRVFV